MENFSSRKSTEKRSFSRFPENFPVFGVLTLPPGRKIYYLFIALSIDPAWHCTEASTNLDGANTSELIEDLDEAMDEQHDLEVASYEQTSQLQVLRLLQDLRGVYSPLPSFPVLA